MSLTTPHAKDRKEGREYVSPVAFHFLHGVRAPAVAALVLVSVIGGCGRASSNLIIDSALRQTHLYWTLSGSAQIVRGVGPGGEAVVYFPGDGRPTGYRNQAICYAQVNPGETYTFSAYIDATGHEGTPPYAFVQAADGTWQGVGVYQSGKGSVAITFAIPASSSTTRVRITLNPSNGAYPVGRGAIYSQLQLEPGSVAHDYVQGIEPPLMARVNLVADSELRLDGEFWNIAGRVEVLHGRGPQHSTLLRIAGTGMPLGYDDSATFVAPVVPGRTYTFSCFFDGSASRSTPPYVFLQAANGTWKGASLWSGARGRASVTFTIPTDSGTTFVRGIFDGENGSYAIGHGAQFAQPQLEAGAAMRSYLPSSIPAALQAPAGGNLVIDSEARESKHSWTLAGRMRESPGGGPGGSNVVVFRGDGRPSGFGNYAAFFAPVQPGETYTLSAYVAGAAHRGTPPYLFATAANGSWSGASVYQPGTGRIFVTFTVPKESGTTMLRCVLNPQNGIYAAGTTLSMAQPQLERGTMMTAYQPSGITKAAAP
jgi:hypothetical protein